MMFGWLKLVFLGAILAELFVRIGAAQLGLLSRYRFGPLSRFGTGFLLALALLGPLFLGIACVGLFYPSLIAMTSVALCLCSRESWKPRLYCLDALREAGFSWPGWLLVAAGLVLLPRLLVPEINHDSYVYHLAVPGQFLESHRIMLSQVFAGFHIPLSVDLVFSLPVLLQDDRLAKLLALLSFLAATAIFSENARREGAGPAAWLGTFLALSSGYIFTLVLVAKNDIPSSALLLGGVLVLGAKSWVLGALLMGASIAGKPIYAVMALAFLALYLRKGRYWTFMAAGLLLPVAPWLAKSYLATGNPTHPFLGALISPFDWDFRHAAAVTDYLDRGMDTSAIGILKMMPERMGGDHLILMLLMPGLFFWKEARKPLIVCLVAGFGILAMSQIERYWLPGIWYLSWLAALAVGRLEIGRRAMAAYLIAGACMLRILLIAPNPLDSWRKAAMPAEDFLLEKLSTYEETVSKLEEISPARLILVGERLIYRLPSRVIYGGQVRETPLIWKMAKESPDVRRLAIKFRQTGASHLLYNYVSAKWVGRRFGAFPWDERMTGMYVDYCKQYQKMVWRTDHHDYSAGGIALYSLRRDPVEPKAKRVWYAPGTEQIYSRVTALRGKRMYDEYLRVAQRGFALMPDVGTAWNEMGFAHYLLGNYREAYRYLREFAEEGMLDEFNLVACGISALESGQVLVAERMLSDSLVRAPDHKKLALMHLSRIVRK